MTNGREFKLRVEGGTLALPSDMTFDSEASQCWEGVALPCSQQT